jgi:hypothetical protein
MNQGKNVIILLDLLVPIDILTFEENLKNPSRLIRKLALQLVIENG